MSKDPDRDSKDELSALLKEVSATADDVVQKDAELRANIGTLAERLVSEANRARVHAVTPGFQLVEDLFDQGHGVHGYLTVGPEGFYLAMRSEWDDILGHDLAPDGSALYSTKYLSDWPVEWVRLVVKQNLMGQLSQRLLEALRQRVADPTQLESLPGELQLPTPAVVETAIRLDFPRVAEAWREAQRDLVTNPSGALRNASVLLETVCKHVLHVRDGDLPSKQTLPNLYRAAAKVLSMDKDEHTLATGLRSVVDGIAHARSHHSNAHGSSPEQPLPSAQHAELAVAAAGALAVHIMRLLSRRELG